jgi:hypothetical protein
MCRLSRNNGTSTSWNPKGLSRPVVGKLYLLHSTFIGRNGVATRISFVYLFEDTEKALELLQEAGLLRNVTPCPTCGRNMTVSKNGEAMDKCRWKCNKRNRSDRCTELEV